MTWESQEERDALADDRDRELWITLPRPCGAAESDGGEMKMSEVYTIQDLVSPEQTAQDYPLIRRLAGEMLKPGPKAGQSCWHREGGRCYRGDSKRLPDGRSTKVCPGVCDSTGPATGSLADIAEALVKKCHDATLFDRIMEYRGQQNKSLNKPDFTGAAIWRWFSIYATPTGRILCCLLALLPETVKVGK